MLAIRMRRTGAKKDAHYRIVVTERSAGRDGRFLEILGHYHPRRQPMEVTFDFDRMDVWIGKGAQMSDTVRSLYKMATGGTVPQEESAPAPVSEPTVAAAEEIEAAAEAEVAEDDVEADAGSESAPEEGAAESAEEPADGDAADGEEE